MGSCDTINRLREGEGTLMGRDFGDGPRLIAESYTLQILAYAPSIQVETLC